MGRVDFDGAAAQAGLDREAVIRRYEAALLAAMARAWGPDRRLEAQLNPETGVFDVYQVLRVARTADDTDAEVGLARAQALGFEAGDEMLLQIFYLDDDAASARHQCAEYPELPSFETLAAGLPAPEGPAWLRERWPGRRPVAWGAGVELPPFEDALERFDRWLRQVAPVEVAGALAPAPTELLEALRRLPAPRELVAFYARFGGACRQPDDLEAPFLDILDAPLVTPTEGQEWVDLHRSAGLEWDPNWLPFQAWIERIYAVDLAEGRVLGWSREDEAPTPLAPSFGAWLGLLAVSAESGVLTWQDGVRVHPLERARFEELRARAFPGAPRPHA